MRRRRGITLIEVLVAIFIMSIGLLALLTLFPLGALRMSSALQDDRTGAAASAAASLCDAFGVRSDPNFYNSAATPPVNQFLAPQAAGFPPAAINGGGYPLYVDPWGFVANNGTLPPVGAILNVTPGIPRVIPSVYPGVVHPEDFATNTTDLAARYFTLPDDVTFATDGVPDTTLLGGSIQRGGRYTWAYLLHRLPPGGGNSALVDLTIVVYAGRATQVPGGETSFIAQGVTNDTSVTVAFPAGSPPNIRRGTWILDTSLNPTTNAVNGDFYRVVAITMTSPTTANLELQTPLAKNLAQPQFAPVGMTSLTVLDNVADVFYRGVSDSSKWEFHAQP